MKPPGDDLPPRPPPVGAPKDRNPLNRLRPWERSAIVFLLKHLAAGAAGAFVAGTGILLLDVAGIGTLVRNSEHGLIAAIMLYVSLFLTFGSVAMGIGIMSLDDDQRP